MEVCSMKNIYDFYFALPSFKRFGKVGRGMDMLLGRFVKKKLDKKIPNQYKKDGDSFTCRGNDSRNEKIIVSMTSFPARINDIWICIESLMRQSFKPDAIELYLSLKQFPDRKIPSSLEPLKKRGLLITFVEDDIRSYKKYYYAMLNHPNDCVVTVDDDVYYPEDALQNLIELHKLYPNSVCANRVHKICYKKNGTIKPYRKWIHNYKGDRTPQERLFVTGVGGVLYPPNSLDDEVFNIEKAREICPMADDVWLNFSAYKKGTKIVGSGKYNKDFIAVGTTQKEKLVSKNVFEGGNDKQIQSVIEYFKIK